MGGGGREECVDDDEEVELLFVDPRTFEISLIVGVMSLIFMLLYGAFVVLSLNSRSSDGRKSWNINALGCVIEELFE